VNRLQPVEQTGYIVYKLSDPRTNFVHYVGLTKNVHKRYAQHLQFPSTHNETKGSWLLGLERDGLMPVVEVIECGLSWETGREREKFWIRYYQSQSAPLTNIIHKSRPARPTPPPEVVKVVRGSRLAESEPQECRIRLAALNSALKERGWTLWQKVCKGQTHIYAARKVNGQRQERYIGPLESLKTLNAQILSDKLTSSH
jgi:GIY-YIG catalytic domain